MSNVVNRAYSPLDELLGIVGRESPYYCKSPLSFSRASTTLAVFRKSVTPSSTPVIDPRIKEVEEILRKVVDRVFAEPVISVENFKKLHRWKDITLVVQIRCIMQEPSFKMFQEGISFMLELMKDDETLQILHRMQESVEWTRGGYVSLGTMFKELYESPLLKALRRLKLSPVCEPMRSERRITKVGIFYFPDYKKRVASIQRHVVVLKSQIKKDEQMSIQLQCSLGILSRNNQIKSGGGHDHMRIPHPFYSNRSIQITANNRNELVEVFNFALQMVQTQLELYKKSLSDSEPYRKSMKDLEKDIAEIYTSKEEWEKIDRYQRVLIASQR